MPEPAWTSDQRRAVEGVGRGLVVSAGAGTGKTAVLAARFVRLIADGGVTPDGESASPCGVGDVLVVTFTNAAAAEMRGRIAARLADAAESAEGDERDRLLDQADRLPEAAIGTISAFCGNLLRRHAVLAGVDAGFVILAEDQSVPLRRRAARATIDAALEADEASDAVETATLLDDLFDGDPAALADTLLEVRQAVWALPRPDAWLDHAAESNANAGERLVCVAADELRAPVEALETTLSEAEDLPALNKLADVATAWARAGRAVLDALDAGDPDGARAAYEEPAGTLQGGKKIALRETVTARVKDLREAWRGALVKAASDGDAELRAETAASAGGFVATIVRLVRDLDRRYAAEKARVGGLDFNDLEHRVHALLEADGGVRDELRRRYRHVLVDESQDLNAIQDEIIRALARPDGLFYVGDVKQSIYGFRNADPSRFLARLAAPAGGLERVDLRENFRSVPKVLEATNAILGRLMVDAKVTGLDYADRHGLEPHDRPAFPANHTASLPAELVVLPREAEADDDDDAEQTEREANWVASRLRAWMAEGRLVRGRDGDRPMTPGDVAVLMRSAKHDANRFAAAMRRAGVPCQSLAGSDFFESVEIRDLLAALRLIDGPGSELDLATYLRSPLSGLPNGCNATDLLARVRLLAINKDAPFTEAADAFAGSDDAEAPAIRAALERLACWRRLAWDTTAGGVVRRVLGDTGYDVFVLGRRDGDLRRRRLERLVERADAFDASRGGDGLAGFLAELADSEESGESGPAIVADAGGEAARVMSVHASKGLEFPVVFLAGCGKAFNLREAGRRVLVDAELGLSSHACDARKQVRYPSPASLLAARRVRQRSLAEELRLLYVAMTRARDHLVCVGHLRSAEARVEDARGTGAGRLPPEAVMKATSFADWLLAAAADDAQFELHAATVTTAAGDGGDAQPRVPPAVLRHEPVATTCAPGPAVAAALRRIAPMPLDARRARRPAVRTLPTSALALRVARLIASTDWAVKPRAAGADRVLRQLGLEELGTDAIEWLATTPAAEAALAAADKRVAVPLLHGTKRTELMRRAIVPLVLLSRGADRVTVVEAVAGGVDPLRLRRLCRLASIALSGRAGRGLAPVAGIQLAPHSRQFVVADVAGDATSA